MKENRLTDLQRAALLYFSSSLRRASASKESFQQFLHVIFVVRLPRSAAFVVRARGSSMFHRLGERNPRAHFRRRPSGEGQKGGGPRGRRSEGIRLPPACRFWPAEALLSACLQGRPGCQESQLAECRSGPSIQSDGTPGLRQERRGMDRSPDSAAVDFSGMVQVRPRRQGGPSGGRWAGILASESWTRGACWSGARLFRSYFIASNSFVLMNFPCQACSRTCPVNAFTPSMPHVDPSVSA